MIESILDGADPETTGTVAVLLLATLQGVAEFLPISSSGHLVLAREVLEVRGVGLALDVALHLGTLVAVLVAYRSEVRALIVDVLAGRVRMAAWLLLATVPVGVVGMTLKSTLEGAAESPRVAGCGLLATAVFLLLGDRARRRQGEAAQQDAGCYGVPAWRLAVLLGLAQMLAICPGVSRSGTTIAAGLALGVPIAQAARLSFLMSIPAISGAAIVQLPDALEVGIGDLSSGLVLGAIALAAVVGWASLRVLLVVTARGAFAWFAAYCTLVALVALTLL